MQKVFDMLVKESYCLVLKRFPGKSYSHFSVCVSNSNDTVSTGDLLI